MRRTVPVFSRTDSYTEEDKEKKLMAALTFAAIDVGSFEVEMGIYEIIKRQQDPEKLDQFRHVTALGRRYYKTERSAMRWWKSLRCTCGVCRIMKS